MNASWDNSVNDLSLPVEAPFFSIVTVTHNDLNGLRACIQSLTNQGTSDFEHIIIDGGSTDGTLEYLNRLRSDRRKVVSEPDTGIYNAINKGIKIARGKVIGLLHADDIYGIGTLSRVKREFEREACDAVYGDAIYYKDNGRPTKYKPARFYGMEAVFRGMPAAHEALFIRRHIYEHFGPYDETYRSAADFKYISRLHVWGVKVRKTYRVELYKREGGVSFSQDVERDENLRLMRERCFSLTEPQFGVLQLLKNYRTLDKHGLSQVYDVLSELLAPSWVLRAGAQALAKIQLGDGPEVDADPGRSAVHVEREAKSLKRVLFTIIGMKSVYGGAERVLTQLANGLAQRGYESLIASADGKVGNLPYELDGSVEFIDILEPPNDRVLGGVFDIHDELCEVIEKLPLEILFVVEQFKHVRREYVDWNQFARLCRFNCQKTEEEIRNTLRREIEQWCKRHGTRTLRWRRAINLYKPATVVAFMISASAQTYIAARKTNTRMIVSNHGNPVRDYLFQDDWDDSMLDRAIRLFALFGCYRSHWLDEAFLSDIPERTRESAFVLPNPVTKRGKTSQGGVGGTRQIVSVGRLVDVKRMDVLIEAFAHSGVWKDNWTLHIYGAGPNLQALREKAEYHNIGRLVTFEGVVPDIPKVLENAEFFVACSEMEGFGLAVAEALNAGLPVVANGRTSGLRDLIVDGQTGLLVPPEEEAVTGFAKRIRELANDPGRRRYLSRMARDTPNGLDIDDFVAGWEKVLANNISQ